jgi:hypothetical protein
MNKSNTLMNVTVGPVLYRDSETKRRHALTINEAVSGFQKATRYAQKHLREKDIFLDFSDRLAKEALASPLICGAHNMPPSPQVGGITADSLDVSKVRNLAYRADRPCETRTATPARQTTRPELLLPL